MRRPSFFDRPAGPLLRVLLLPLDLVALLYGAAAALHRRLYERGTWRRARLACRVVSVGNLVVGGSGKTPAAAWIAAGLRRRGHRVALASRGYGRLGRDRVEVVSDGRHVRSSVRTAGDEPLVLAARAPGVPVLVGRRRDVVGLRALAAFGTQVLVLDDGFQHHRLERDVDLVLVDGATGLGNRRVLPRGPLRERPGVLSRAAAVGVVDGPLRPEDEALLSRFAPRARRFALQRRPTLLRPIAGGRSEPPSMLADREVGLVCGLASPVSFRMTLEKLGARVVAERVLPDHHAYVASDLRGLAREARTWITTEKDAVKILPRWAEGAGIDLRVLVLDVSVEDADGFLDWLEERLRPKPRGRDAALPAQPPAPSRAGDG